MNIKGKVALVTGASSGIGEADAVRGADVMAIAEEPGIVADVVVKSASAAKPKLRYTAAGSAFGPGIDDPAATIGGVNSVPLFVSHPGTAPMRVQHVRDRLQAVTPPQ